MSDNLSYRYTAAANCPKAGALPAGMLRIDEFNNVWFPKQGGGWVNSSPLSTTSSQSGLGQGLIETYRAAIVTNGGTINDKHLDSLRGPLDTLIRTSAWAKIRWLWLPLGDNLAAALTVLKKPAGLGTTLVGTSLVAGDYSPRKGITGNGTSKLITSDFNPSAQGMVVGEQGFGCYAASGGNTGFSEPSGFTGAGWPQGQILAGTASGQTYWLGHSGVLSAQISNSNYTLLDNTTRSYGRLLSVQTSALSGVQSVETRRQSTVVARAPVALGSLSQSSGALQALGYNAGAAYCSATVAGLVYFDALTDAEYMSLSTFFDSVNASVGRAFNPTLVGAGDSITFGSGVTTAERWTALLASRLGLIEDNQGTPGAKFQPNTYGNLLYDRQAKLYGSNGNTTVMAYGINSICLAAGDRVEMRRELDAARLSVAEMASGGYDMDRFIIVGPAAISYTDMVAAFPAYAGWKLTDQQWFVNEMAALASAYKARFVDMLNTGSFAAAVASRPKAVLQDGLHPNAAGHVLFADDIQRVVLA